MPSPAPLGPTRTRKAEAKHGGAGGSVVVVVVVEVVGGAAVGTQATTPVAMPLWVVGGTVCPPVQAARVSAMTTIATMPRLRTVLIVP